jgi:hypothetical protein
MTCFLLESNRKFHAPLGRQIRRAAGRPSGTLFIEVCVAGFRLRSRPVLSDLQAAPTSICCIQGSPLRQPENCGHFSQNALSARRKTPVSCFRLSVVQWRSLIELFGQAGPVFRVPLAAWADRQMSRPSREQELPDIERECANLVFGEAARYAEFAPSSAGELCPPHGIERAR